MVSANAPHQLNSKLARHFAFSNSLLLHHVLIDRRGLMIFKFLQIAFLLTRGDFATSFLEEIKNEIGFNRLHSAMKHQIVMCMEQSLSISIREDVKAHESKDFTDFFLRPKGFKTGYHWDKAIEDVGRCIC